MLRLIGQDRLVKRTRFLGLPCLMEIDRSLEALGGVLAPSATDRQQERNDEAVPKAGIAALKMPRCPGDSWVVGRWGRIARGRSRYAVLPGVGVSLNTLPPPCRFRLSRIPRIGVLTHGTAASFTRTEVAEPWVSRMVGSRLFRTAKTR